MMLANVKVPSIPTSAACVQLTNAESSSYTFYNRQFTQLLHRTASSKYSYLQLIYNSQLLHHTASYKHRYLQIIYIQLSTTSSDCFLLNTDTSSYLQLSITSSDCVLLQAADVGILGTFTFTSIIPSCSFTFASIIPPCSFPFQESSLHFSFFIKAFLLYLLLLLFYHYQLNLLVVFCVSCYFIL